MDEADLESELDRLTAPDEIYDVAADLKQTLEAIRARTAAWASAHAPPDLDGKIEEAMLYLCMDARTYADADEEDDDDEQTLLLASSKADEHTPLLASSKKKETNWMGLRQRAEAVAPMPRPPEAVAMPPVPSPGLATIIRY